MNTYTVGIITFHKAANYGAVLQAYALQEVIKSMGNIQVSIIDYTCKQVEYDHSYKSLLKRRGFLRYILNYRILKKRRKVFDEFIDRRLELTNERIERGTLRRLNKQFDCFIVGSDQIWNDKLSGFDMTFMLDFVTDKNKKYAYAASFGFQSIPEKYKASYCTLLKAFKGISVREESAEKIFEKEMDLSVPVCLDPTLLCNKKQWMEIAKMPNQTSKYILLYAVQPPRTMKNYARKISVRTGYPVIYLNDGLVKDLDLKHVRCPLPEEFVGWFANAEYVITNSFHGTAFSIIFERNFFVEIQTKLSPNVRSEDLLHLCGLENRIIEDGKCGAENEKINWKSVNEKLSVKKDESMEYLKCIMNEVGRKI